MRIEQRIGRVDRIGQKHIVRALNMVLEGTVEYRVREVLEQKLAVILEEFGTDKTSDVLDSPEIFDELYVESMLHPEQVPERVEQTLERVRQQAEAARRSIALLGTGRALDPNIAQQMLEHPLPHWVERMTVSYLNSHGGKAERRGRVWDLTWPASTNAGAMRSVAFHNREQMTCPVLSTSGWMTRAFVDWRSDCHSSCPARPSRESGWRTSPMKSVGTGRSGEFA